MTKNKEIKNTKEKEGAKKQAVPSTAAGIKVEKKVVTKGRGIPHRKPRRRGPGVGESQEEFEQRIVDIARVTRVMAGGKRMRFRACVALGNKKGKVGIGLAKGADVTIAVTKAVNKAKKNIIDVPIVNDTIPHEIYHKFGAAKILFKPARKGRGVIAGGAVRVILELTGIKNVTSKILGTNNKVNNAKCVIEALSNLKRVEKKDGAKQKEKKNDNKPLNKDEELKTKNKKGK